MRQISIECQRFDRPVGLKHNGAPRCFVTPSRLHAYISILHYVDSTDSIRTGNLIQVGEDARRSHFLAIDRDDVATLVFQFDIGRLVWRLVGASKTPCAKEAPYMVNWTYCTWGQTLCQLPRCEG